MLRRQITPHLLAALADTPVVLLHGARQTGKTTLVREIAKAEHPARYLTFDDPAVRGAAEADPHGFVDGLEGPVVIDEVQRVPGLPLAIKAAVDRNRSPGRFFLTGSANVLQVPRLAESLTGRMEIHTLWPLSQGEIEGRQENFIDTLFSNKAPKLSAVPRKGHPLTDRIARGGYPELITRHDDARRRSWFASYLDTILQRDVRDLANIEGLTSLPNLLALIASRTGGLLNYADLSRSIQISQTTLKRYLALLEMTFLIQSLPPWHGNLGLRIVKSPKLFLSDTGLLMYLLKSDRRRMGSDLTMFGSILENFAITELRKAASWSHTKPSLFHYRTHTGGEVDLVLEGRGGRIIGIEIKAGSSISGADLKGLKQLQEAAGERFHRGVLLYGGTESVPVGRGLLALPIPAIWSLGKAQEDKRN